MGLWTCCVSLISACVPLTSIYLWSWSRATCARQASRDPGLHRPVCMGQCSQRWPQGVNPWPTLTCVARGGLEAGGGSGPRPQQASWGLSGQGTHRPPSPLTPPPPQGPSLSPLIPSPEWPPPSSESLPFPSPTSGHWSCSASLFYLPPSIPHPTWLRRNSSHPLRCLRIPLVLVGALAVRRFELQVLLLCHLDSIPFSCVCALPGKVSRLGSLPWGVFH